MKNRDYSAEAQRLLHLVGYRTEPEHIDQRWRDGLLWDVWRCRLKHRDSGRVMQVTFWMGLGHKGEAPCLLEVLENLQADATCAIYDDPEEFASELGYPYETSADRKYAKKVHSAVIRQTERLQRFLGAEDFETLMGVQEW